MRAVRLLLGHTNLESTVRYLYRGASPLLNLEIRKEKVLPVDFNHIVHALTEIEADANLTSKREVKE